MKPAFLFLPAGTKCASFPSLELQASPWAHHELGALYTVPLRGIFAYLAETVTDGEN